MRVRVGCRVRGGKVEGFRLGSKFLGFGVQDLGFRVNILVFRL